MALTVTRSGDWHSVYGHWRKSHVQIAFDSSYLAGGEPLVPADFGLRVIDMILIEPKNALVKQYQKIMNLDGVELVITEGAMKATARQSLKRKTGARALRTIFEEVMLDVMYDIPSQESVKKCVIDEEVIDRKKPPLLFMSDGRLYQPKPLEESA